MRWIGVMLALCATPAMAQLAPGNGAGAPEQPVLDGQLRLRHALLDALGPGALRMGALLDPAGPGVLVRTRRALSAQVLDRFGLTQVDDHLATGRVTWDRLAVLAEHPAVERVEPGHRLSMLRPLDTIGAQQGSLRAHLRPVDGQTGDGVIVAAIDGPVDVLHPHFFFADGGVFEWLDANGDGRFQPGDAVLFDDATVGRLQVMDGFFFDPVTDPTDWQNFDAQLDPRRDWLFADLNGDGLRNAGAADGFDDDSPSLGEPIFVAHDVDENGQLDPDEKLFMLGTSKIRQMWVEDRAFARGLNLAAAADVPNRVDASHGTGVASILLGGQAGFHDRVGLAPGAEYVGYHNVDEGRMGLVLADAEERGAMLMLHEWSQPVGVVGDGGSIFEGAMDSARARGMLQVCPLGNLNRAGKQAELIAEGGSVAVEFRVGEGFFDGQQTRPFGLVQAHVAWQDADPRSLRVQVPGGEPVDLDLSGQPIPLGGESFIAATLDRGGRGAGILNLILFRGDGYTDPLPEGVWRILLDGLTPGTPVHGRITDAWSGWGEGVGWTRPTPDRTSLTYPSTADSAIGVAAFGGRLDMRDFGDSNVGELRNYSGRGPRIDGAPAVDIAAPDDPLAALATSPVLDFPAGHSSGFTMFGGTSGAGPHVAATAVLLHAQHPEWDADALEARLFDATVRDALAPDLGALPNDGWGHGKLLLHQTLFDTPPPTNAPPEGVSIAFAWRDGVFTATGAATDPEDDPLWFRWDRAYDGDWDSDWLESPDFAIDGVAPGDSVDLWLAVRDPLGGAVDLLARVEVPAEPQPEPMPEPEAPDAGDDPVADAGTPDGSPAEREPPVDPERAIASDSGCATAPGDGAGWALGLLLLALAVRRRSPCTPPRDG